MLIYGINTVLEALKSRRVRRLRVGSRSDTRMDGILSLAGLQRVPVERADAQALDRAARGGVHQGVVAEIEEMREYRVEELGGGPGGAPLIVVLDGIEDPQNVGAILRACDAAGATGIIRQTRHAAALDGIVAKASAGALASARIATVVNIARAVDQLKSANIWTVGLAADTEEAYTEVDWTLPSALVLGAEGRGLRRLVRESCDRVVRIPMLGTVESLNVSVAAGVVLYEAVRQRREAAVRHVEGR